MKYLFQNWTNIMLEFKLIYVLIFFKLTFIENVLPSYENIRK
jgi:hypothetical protein